MQSISLSKLYEIYCSIGVRKISEAVVKCADSLNLSFELRQLSQKENPISNGLCQTYLGLSCESMPWNFCRKKAIVRKALLDLAVYETDDPITVSYELLLPCQSRSLAVKETDSIRWDKNSQRLIIKKAHGQRKRTIAEFATNFAKVVSSGMLWDSTDLVNDLSRLIKLGCVLGFDLDTVDFLLITENLLLFRDDEEFLDGSLNKYMISNRGMFSYADHQ